MRSDVWNPGESWSGILAQEFKKDYFRELARFVEAAYAAGPCHPRPERIFSAFRRTPFERVKAVIVGQDPYHGPGQAHGLCFSVQPPCKPPPSLANIFKELELEYGEGAIDRDNGDLTSWADDGVLLLNATLTVGEGAPLSHAGRGWERFTDAAIAALAAHRENLVFMLWGGPARAKGKGIDRARHLVLEAPHPSPLSAYRGFFGCGHFKAADEFFAAHAIAPVDWTRRRAAIH